MDFGALTDEVLARCDRLGAISDDPRGLSRTFLSPASRLVQQELSHWMAEAGLQVRVDAAGNLIGSTAERESVFLVGSHLDTVLNAGKYDGPLGVLLGIAAAKVLSDRTLSKRLDVIAFSEEEGVRFRTPYLGSLAVCGRLTAELLERKDANGVTVADAIRAFGLDPAKLPDAAYPPRRVVGYLEAHIEQGPVLESLGLPLGIVPAIMGQTRAWITVTGEAGHAGTQPMELRRDALAAAALLVSEVERVGRRTPELRATVGALTVLSGGTNVVPGEAKLSLDVRHAEDAIRREAVAGLFEFGQSVALQRLLKITIEIASEQAAVACDPALTARLAKSAEAFGPAPVLSGAGHDAAIMASLCPVAMLFLRSPGGISHSPKESVIREDVKAALAGWCGFSKTN